MTLYFDDTALPNDCVNVQATNRVGSRKITHVFHDIDGTHSSIRDWVPVMSAVLDNVIEGGLAENYDADQQLEKLASTIATRSRPLCDRFCIESAGLSALTQMEWAIRSAIAQGSIDPVTLNMNADAIETNQRIVDRIWAGEEIFETSKEPETLKAYLAQHSVRLFKFYERLLNRVTRDVNLADARRNPEPWRVTGSYAFLNFLREAGAVNYFITGAVVSPADTDGKLEGMAEEIDALGYQVGPGEIIEGLYGSSWDVKRPKNQVMQKLCDDMRINPKHVLVVGDGRSEIAAGVKMNAVTMSRLPIDATRQREIHHQLGTNLIVSDYSSPELLACLRHE